MPFARNCLHVSYMKFQLAACSGNIPTCLNDVSASRILSRI